LLIASFLLSSPAEVLAQSQYGSMRGVVRDASAVVPGVEVASGSARRIRPTAPSGVQPLQSGLTPVDRRWKRATAAAVFAGAAAIAWVGWSAWPRREAAPSLITRFTMQPTLATSLGSFAVSPDGREIAYTGSPVQEGQLFVRRLDQIEDVPIPGTEGGHGPFYSPDGQWIGFSTDSRLMKVHVRAGTTPVTLCECVDRAAFNGAAWLEGGSVVFTRPDRALQRVSAEGGEPSDLTPLLTSPKELDHHAPSPLPGGRALLFTSHAATGTFDVEVVRLDTGERKTLVKAAYDARYLASGHLVYTRRGAILAAPFDVDRLETTGPEVTLVEGVADRPDSGYGAYTVSLNGTLVYRAAPSLEGRALAWVTRDGLEIPVPLTPRAFSSPRVSPDGTRLAFAVAESGRRDIWTYELGTQKLARLTREGDNKVPVWSRDGRRLAYSSTRDGTPKIWVQPADASSPPEAIATGEDVIVPASWSAGDRAIVYVHADTSASGSRTAVVAVSGDRRPQQLFPDETRGPAVSPDGRWIAFTSTDARVSEVSVSDFPSVSTRHQISAGGGRQPLWRRDGRELVYRSRGGRMFSVAVDLAGGFRSAAPVLLFERPYASGDRDVMGFDYDLAPDGRFLMIKPSPAELRTDSVNVVVNWIDELTRRVPPG